MEDKEKLRDIRGQLIDMVTYLEKENPDDFTYQQLFRLYELLFSIFNSKEEYAQDVRLLQHKMKTCDEWNNTPFRNRDIRERIGRIINEGAYL